MEIQMQSIVIKEEREGLIVTSRSCPEKIYLEIHVPKNIHCVTRVIFRIVSHDQGEYLQPTVIRRI
jgi:hypothetical protein